MNFEKIHRTVIDVYKFCEIQSFPIDCFSILDFYSIKYESYMDQSEQKRDYCFMVSDDAFTLDNIIFYNNQISSYRLRFSLMHELGHILLGHSSGHAHEAEQEANYFASNILAPRMAIHYSRCKNFKGVSKTFDISFSAADIAFNDHRRWWRIATYKMSVIDKEMYNHFYNEEIGGFVWKITRCKACTKDIYNSSDRLCAHCYEIENRLFSLPLDDKAFLRAEYNWLYGACE